METHERLKIAVTYLQKVNPDLTYHDIMREAGYKSGSHLSDMLRGSREITEKFLYALEKKFFINRRWVREGEGDIILKPQANHRLYPSEYYIPNMNQEQLAAAVNMILQELAQQRSVLIGKPVESCLVELYGKLKGILS
jgi:hypothetical protein